MDKIYADLVCLHDKVHTYHIRTVNMAECATFHLTLGKIYQGLAENVDSFGENVLQKFFKKPIPSVKECVGMSSYTSNEATNKEDILSELYANVEELMGAIAKENNKANNCLAQLISPIWEDFTDYCADLDKEMEEEDEETKEIKELNAKSPFTK